ncbi:MAG: phosphatidylglycerophosphatase A [Candidatus Thermoplasmatota archaeon]|nr:phosphatidylglycerophosphatase A [Candidatus Thermoplasmatota archaeon]
MEKASEVLSRHGVDLDSLVEAGFALYAGELTTEQVVEKKRQLEELLEANINDLNVALLLEAASHLDRVLTSDDESRALTSNDPAFLVADELIGMSIAEYIAGKRGLFNYVRYDREKPGIIGVLPPFMDDAVGALVAASMTRLFE